MLFLAVYLRGQKKEIYLKKVFFKFNSNFKTVKIGGEILSLIEDKSLYIFSQCERKIFILSEKISRSIIWFVSDVFDV